MSVPSSPSTPSPDFSGEYHEIIPNLFLGSCVVARNISTLKSLGITHILNCSYENPEYFSNDFTYLSLPLRDSCSQNIIQYFDRAYEFIHAVLFPSAASTASTRKGKSSIGKVYVHCQAGISRSSTIVIAYLMKLYSQSFQKVLHYVRGVRKIVNPNEGFRLQLECYEDEIMKLRDIRLSNLVKSIGNLKYT